MRVIAIIPAYNEEETIGDVIKETKKYVDDVIVINDGSTDRTEEIAKKAGAKVVSHVLNRGVGAAVRTGIDTALSLGADIIVNIDADGQFDPKDIKKLITPIINNEADFVTGSRFLNANYKLNIPKIKKVGNTLFTKIVNFLTKSNFTDTQCGFRAFYREAALRLNLYGNFTYTQEVFLDLVSKGMKIKEVPIKVVYKSSRKSKVVKNPFYYGINALLIIIRTIRDLYPLKFFGIIGLIIFSSGFVMGLFLLLRWALKGIVSPYRSMIQLSAVLLIVGFLSIVLALIADMLGRQKRIQEEILYYSKLKAFEKNKGEKFE